MDTFLIDSIHSWKTMEEVNNKVKKGREPTVKLLTKAAQKYFLPSSLCGCLKLILNLTAL